MADGCPRCSLLLSSVSVLSRPVVLCRFCFTGRLGSGHISGRTAPRDGRRATLNSGELGRVTALPYLVVACWINNRLCAVLPIMTLLGL